MASGSTGSKYPWATAKRMVTFRKFVIEGLLLLHPDSQVLDVRL
jgi:hypothetical protein